MNSKMRCNLPGTFSARDLEAGAWRLSRRHPAPADVFLRGVEAGAADALRSSVVADIDIEWRADAVMLTMTCDERPRSIKPSSAIVHEPLAHLYESMPLVNLDAKARRFWRGVFRLVRIPGGRYLVGILARRRGSGR
jgi:hypothetical protein